MESKNNMKFKTNINCGGCIKAVTPHLNKAEGIAEWQVDTDHADKILTIESEGITEENIIAIVKKAGFNIEPLQEA
ncbi:MAG: heavy-metal-associated domain-containing protein [Chitinophagales bacterium]|nr:heavy-metal-associated domain-containing protein [Chitinophagales bacterium]